MTDSIYLDNNATTFIHPDVAAAMCECLQARLANPASQHALGRAARRVLEDARETVARHLGARLDPPRGDLVLFTSGGTESNNLAVRGLARVPGHVLVSSLEHPSALAACSSLEKQGYEVEQIPCTSRGHLDLARFELLLRPDTRLVVAMMGNNEIGTLQPIDEIGERCADRNIPFHVDAVQVAGKLPIDFRRLGASTLAISAHKFHGPRGIGVLVVRGGIPLEPLMLGGSQQLGLRPGTESVAACVGMARALDLAVQHQSRVADLARRRDRLENALLEHLQPCIVNGEDPRLPHTTNLSFVGLDRQAMVMALDMAGVACSTGSACSSGSSEPSHVLLAVGCRTEVVESSVRFSLSFETTDAQIETAIHRITSVVKNLRSSLEAR